MAGNIYTLKDRQCKIIIFHYSFIFLSNLIVERLNTLVGGEDSFGNNDLILTGNTMLYGVLLPGKYNCRLSTDLHE